MDGADGNNTPRRVGDHRNTSMIRTVEDLSARHGRRLRRWLSTWDAVDHSLLTRLASQVRESNEACLLVPSTIPLLDSIQDSSEAQVVGAIERIEHLIVICQRAGTTGPTGSME